jgi:hypothetical protein
MLGEFTNVTKNVSNGSRFEGRVLDHVAPVCEEKCQPFDSDF